MTRLLVRADGGEEIGLGHWSRCLVILSCLDKMDISASLFTKNPEGFYKAFPDEQIAVNPLENDAAFIDLIKSEDIIILDGYHFDSTYFQAIKQRGALLIFIDDLLKKNISADVIINQSLSASPADYIATAPYASFYLGSSYSLVPPYFKKTSVNKAERLNNLLVCMGGADPTNKLQDTLINHEAIIGGFSDVYVVFGPHYQYEDQIKKRFGHLKNIQFLKGISKNHINDLMQVCGVAILSSSTIALEYAHIGGVLGILKTADNQKRMFAGLLAAGVAVETNVLIKGKSQFAGLYDRLISNQHDTFDGCAKERYRRLFAELAQQQELKLRNAVESDVHLTFKWASDNKIRKYSFSKSEISWDEHEKWFKQKLKDDICLYLVAEYQGLPIGSVRFDLKEHEAVISYLIDGAFHGRGFGRIILSEGIQMLLKSGITFDTLVGYVIEENVASLRVFERMGFDRVIEGDKVRYYKNIIA